MESHRTYLWVALVCLFVVRDALQQPQRKYENPSIIQDSRNLPQVDGTFGFLYRTEDGISHGAVGEPGGAVHGRFTYTDPTGLKVNFNYNAGSQATSAAADRPPRPPQPPQQPPPPPPPPPSARSSAPRYIAQSRDQFTGLDYYEEEPRQELEPRPLPRQQFSSRRIPYPSYDN